MHDRTLIKDFWACGDNQIIEFAIMRARLNRKEKEVLELILDECKTQEEAAETLDLSPRNIQEIWRRAADKMLAIPWVKAYAHDLRESR